MDRTLRDKKAIIIFILPALIIFSFVVVTSIVMSGYYSTLDWDGIGKQTFIGLDNYKMLFVNNTDGFIRATGNSLILAVCSIIGQLIPAMILALFITSGIKLEGFFRNVFFIPVVLSSVAIGQLWIMIYNPTYGLLNKVLEMIGLKSWTHSWIGDEKTALAAVFMVIIWQYIGYHMMLIYSGIKRISADIYEAAKIDGAGELQTALKITIPLVLPTVKTCIILAVIGSLKMFDLIYVITNGGPLGSTEVPSTMMFKSIFYSNMYGYGSSIAIFIVLECLVLTGLINLFKPKQYTY